MKRNSKPFLRLLASTLCLAMTLSFAAGCAAEMPQAPGYLKETVVTAAGTITGVLDAKGQFYTDYATLAEEQAVAKELAIRIAEEGDVLLKNENNVLPLSSSVKMVSLFGMHTTNLIPSGGGSSGGTLGNNGIDPSTLKQAFEDAGFHVNQKLIDLYTTYNALGTIPNELPVSYYGNSITGTYAGYGDAAVITLARRGAEDGDLATYDAVDHANPDDHSLMLDDNERDLIKHVKQYFDTVIVIINSSNVMQLPELAEAKTADNLGVDAILWVGNTGNNAIEAVPAILSGKVNPSGHVVDIWTKDFTTDPTWTNVSENGQNKAADGTRLDAQLYTGDEGTGYYSVEYREGIYMGYRYYETVAADMNAAEAGSGDAWYDSQVLFPFGYGLSYTSFDWELDGSVAPSGVIDSAASTVTVNVKVTNTGSVAGKDVVQLYYTAPYTVGGIEKASANLVSFAKTDLLQPGESQVVTMQLVAQDMASFDYSDANGNGFYGYELEAGEYSISARRNSHDPVLSITRNVEKGIQCTTDYTSGNEIKPLFSNDDDYNTVNTALEENLISRKDGLSQPAPSSKEDRTISASAKKALDEQATYFSYQDTDANPWYVESVPANWTQASEHKDDYSDVGIMLNEMSGIPYTEADIVDGKVIAAEDENTRKWDEFMNQLTWTEIARLVNIGGSKSEAIPSIGMAKDGMADGSTQISGGTLWPSAPVLAATWNLQLAEKQGRMVGNESIFKNVPTWYGPSMDIHRSPFSGRNFEYYSQDGVQSGMFAAAVVRGATAKGLNTMVKHMFLNDQEKYRNTNGGVLTWCTEQALREIYAKPFEYVVKDGHATSVMTSFNRIGSIPNSLNYAVHQQLLRDEWGFTGFTATDMWVGKYCPVNLMVRAGDDMVLAGSPEGTDFGLTYGEWDAAANCVRVPASAEDSTNSVLSPTHYYAVRKSAQRMLYVFCNSNNNDNGIVAGSEIAVTLDQGVYNTRLIELDATNDLVVSLHEGEEMPAGLALDGSVIVGTPAEEGTFYILLDIVCDGWINSTASLRIDVQSAMHYTGTPVETLKVGESVDGTFRCDYYAYRNLIRNPAADENTPFYMTSVRVLNWYTYATNDGGTQNATALVDQTAPDLSAIDPADAVESHIYGYTYSGDLPDGMNLEEVKTMDTNGYEVADGLRLTGAPAKAGTYTFTVTARVPYVLHYNVWDLFLHQAFDTEYSRTITIVVE